MSNEAIVLEIQRGHKEYFLQLWQQTERFIGQQAGRYMARLDRCRGVEEADLKQAGFLALVDAAEQYSPEGGASFIHYLSYWLHHHFSEAAGLRTDRTTADPINSSISFTAPLEADGEATLEDILADPQNDIAAAERNMYLSQLRAALNAALGDLDAKEAEILRERYFHGKTLREVSEARGVSMSRIRELEQKGLRKLRTRKHWSALESYIEVRTPYYLQTNFQHSQTSAVESLVMLRERLRKEFEEKQTRKAAGGKVWRRHRDAYRNEV